MRSWTRFLGVEVPLLLQYSIALCTGLVAATLVPPIRKSIPRPVEFVLWMALLAACVVGVISITNPHARELTTSTFWAVDQVISTLVGLMGVAFLGWLADNRFTIATCLVFVVGADLMGLAMAYSYRKSLGWQPRVRLGDAGVPAKAAGRRPLEGLHGEHRDGIEPRGQGDLRELRVV